MPTFVAEPICQYQFDSLYGLEDKNVVDETDRAVVSYLRVSISSSQINAVHRPLHLRLFTDSSINTVADGGSALSGTQRNKDRHILGLNRFQRFSQAGRSKDGGGNADGSSAGEFGAVIHMVTACTAPLDQLDHYFPKTVNISYCERPPGPDIEMGACLGGFGDLKKICCYPSPRRLPARLQGLPGAAHVYEDFPLFLYREGQLGQLGTQHFIMVL
ncbi:hypothetical protein DFH09DRAFT_1076481 [Mycena vulgaris]|nr:hypothetical protein DFH09DRAFT_1076481 [Mycena vulgaris]